MQFIIRFIFTGFLILASSFIINAQDFRTLNTSDGTKYFEGNILIKNKNATVSTNSYLYGDGLRERDLSDNWKNIIAPYLPENIFNLVYLDGVCKLFYKNGSVNISQEYDLFVANGKYEEHYLNGDLMINGNYKNGMMDGQWKYFFKNGKTAFEGSFYALTQTELFKKVSSPYSGRNYNKENSFSEEHFEFANPVTSNFNNYDRFLIKLGTGLNGRYNFYYYDGQKNVSINYTNGLPDGFWQYWDRNGKLLYKAEFKSGIPTMIQKDGVSTTYNQYTQTQKVSGVRFYQGDVNGIDPGIVEAAAGLVEAPTEPSIFRYVEQTPAPTFVLNDWINKNLKYPIEAKKNGTEGRVIVEFVVQNDGRLSNVKVLRGIGSGCDEAAVALIKKMPNWKPGKQNGKAVAVYYNLPITFKLAQ